MASRTHLDHLPTWAELVRLRPRLAEIIRRRNRTGATIPSTGRIPGGATSSISDRSPRSLGAALITIY